MPKQIEVDKLTPQQLKNLLANAERMGEAAVANAVVREMAARGIATHREYRALAWNQERVRDIMKPFKDVAAAVPGNQRTAYTEAGGFKIGRAKDDPEHLWINTYSAIKNTQINVTFGCNIKRPGDEPVFELRTDGKTIQVYNADHLSSALEQWQLIGRIAAEDEILRAQPVEGEVDFAQLTREIIGRFPKILAALAE